MSSSYNARERVLRAQIRENMSTLRKEYCSAGLDSRYFYKCDTINKLFEQTVIMFQQLGISCSTIKEISVSPNLPSDLANQIQSELADDVVRTDGYYSLRKYIDMYCNIRDMDGQYTTGLFGIQIRVPFYTYDAGSALQEMEKDMKSSWSSNAIRVRNTIAYYWDNFCKKLSSEVDAQKNILKKQVDTYRSFLTRSMNTKSFSAALTYLEQLGQEAEI